MKTKCASPEGAESKKSSRSISGKGVDWSPSLSGISPEGMFPQSLGPGSAYETLMMDDYRLRNKGKIEKGKWSHFLMCFTLPMSSPVKRNHDSQTQAGLLHHELA